jgi:hypothetical protein
MSVSFAMEDEFLEGDYDSRIKNDVILYIFQDDVLTYTQTFPYAEIAERAEVTIPKTAEVLGDIKFVAWAVPMGTMNNENGEGPAEAPVEVHDPNVNPVYEIGSSYDDHLLKQAETQQSTTGGKVLAQTGPTSSVRYIGTLHPFEEESMSRNSHHDIMMHPAPGRVIVNVTDPNNFLGEEGNEPSIVIGGTMSEMNLDLEGVGKELTVGAPLFEYSTILNNNLNDIELIQDDIDDLDDEHYLYTTKGTVGVMPSKAGEPIYVQIYAGDKLLETLTVTSDDHLLQAIESGELLEFSYTLNSASFIIRIGDWTERIVIASM